jgi:hypothetical protein
MRVSLAVLVLLFVPTAATLAVELSCPDVVAAVQVGSCPTENELKFTFTGYCSDDRRMYDQVKDMDVCASFENYRRVKNTALWESSDGAFDAYLSCDLSKDTIKAAKVTGISVKQQDKLTKVVCTYDGDIAFIHRTKGRCKVEGDGDCRAHPAACKAHCDNNGDKP